MKTNIEKEVELTKKILVKIEEIISIINKEDIEKMKYTSYELLLNHFEEYKKILLNTLKLIEN